MSIKKMHIIFKGEVQGVGFRFWAKSIADTLQIRGYVKNLLDGSVEVIAIGEERVLQTFIEEIRQKIGQEKIKEINVSCFPLFHEIDGFEIQF